MLHKVCNALCVIESSASMIRHSHASPLVIHSVLPKSYIQPFHQFIPLYMSHHLNDMQAVENVIVLK